MNILFVCTGNLYRSQAAEAFAIANGLPKKYKFDSAGLSENSAKGKAVPRKLVDVLATRFLVDFPEGKKSKQLTSELTDWASVIAYMQPSHRTQLLDLGISSKKIVFLGEYALPPIPKKIPDLAFTSDRLEFENVLGLIQHCVNRMFW